MGCVYIYPPWQNVILREDSHLSGGWASISFHSIISIRLSHVEYYVKQHVDSASALEYDLQRWYLSGCAIRNIERGGPSLRRTCLYIPWREHIYPPVWHSIWRCDSRAAGEYVSILFDGMPSIRLHYVQYWFSHNLYPDSLIQYYLSVMHISFWFSIFWHQCIYPPFAC